MMKLLSKLLNAATKHVSIPSDSSRSRMTLNDFFDQQYFPHATVTRRRPQIARYIFDKHIRPTLGHLRFDEISNKVLDDWVRAHIEKRYKPGTINKHIFVLNRILNVAHHWGFLEHAVHRNCTIKRLPQGDYKQRFLKERELMMLLDACQRDQHPFLYYFAKLLILTGARSSEARLARWVDFDMQRKSWIVPVSKNGRSRQIILSNAAVILLNQIRVQAERLYLPTTQKDYIFLNPKTRKPYTCFFLAWDRARQRVNMPEVRIHDLRHTYASILINRGTSIYEVQTLLGHHHVSMTERYAHLAPNTLAARVEIVADVLD